MLVFSSHQLQQLEEASLRRFEDEMLQHSQAFSPRLCQVLGNEPLRVAVRQALQQAQRFGFTQRGPMRLIVELMFLFGSGFATDPQYPALGRILGSEGDQMRRADAVYEAVLAYQDRVVGPDASNVRTALDKLLQFAEAPMALTLAQFPQGMVRELGQVFPQKADFVGHAALVQLVDAGCAEASAHGFDTVRAMALMVALKFAFGHGCANDPLYPWIARTLADDRIDSPQSRAMRLERKSLTWLRQVLASPTEQGAA